MIISKEFLKTVLTEKELDAIDIINNFSKTFRGTYEHMVYASGQIIVYLNRHNKFINKVRPYVSEEDYEGLLNIVKKHGDNEFEVYITLKDAKDILDKAGITKEESRNSMEDKNKPNFWDGSDLKKIYLSYGEMANYYRHNKDQYSGLEDFVRYHKLSKEDAAKFKKELNENISRYSVVESLTDEEIKDSIENGIGLSPLDREEKNIDGEDVFKSDDAYDAYIDIFILNNARDEEAEYEDKEFEELTNGYVECIWDLFNHFLKNVTDLDIEKTIEKFERKDELTGLQVEIATDVFNAYNDKIKGNIEGNKFFNLESVIIESAIKKPKIGESDRDILKMLKNHGYNYLVRNSNGTLMAYEVEPVKAKGEDWHAHMSMPYQLSQQYMFKFIKSNNRKPYNINTLLQSEELQVDTMQESTEEDALKALKTKYGIGAIDLFPNILYDLYEEIMEENYPEFTSEDFDVFASYFPDADGMYWELFVKSPLDSDNKPWGDAISTETMKSYMVNDDDLEKVDKILNADEKLIRAILNKDITESLDVDSYSEDISLLSVLKFLKIKDESIRADDLFEYVNKSEVPFKSVARLTSTTNDYIFNQKYLTKVEKELKAYFNIVKESMGNFEEYDTLEIEEVLEQYGFEMESLDYGVATFTNDEADHDIIVFLDTKEFLNDMVDDAIMNDLIEIGYFIKGESIEEMTQASAIGTKVDYPKKKSRKRRSGK